jgi:hypothetical protein
MFKRVLISNSKNEERLAITNNEDYQIHKDLRKGYFYEILGLPEYQVKPYFDLDPKGEFDYKKFDEFEEDLKKIIDVPIYSMGRKAREENGVIKHSRRYYIKARITFSNIPIVFKELSLGIAINLPSLIEKLNRFCDSSVAPNPYFFINSFF